MTKEIKELLEAIVDRDTNDWGYQDIAKLQDQATILLYEDFKKEVLETFDYEMKYSCSKHSFHEIILKGDKVGFIKAIWQDESKQFINEHFNKLDVIIEILQEELKEKENENE